MYHHRDTIQSNLQSLIKKKIDHNPHIILLKKTTSCAMADPAKDTHRVSTHKVSKLKSSSIA